MFQPEMYSIALIFLIGSMICWGSWANTMKLTPGWAFQLFYWDYVIGMILAILGWGFTLGSRGTAGLSFLADLHQANPPHIAYAIAGGITFNIANILLVSAIEIAGLAVAFPLGIGVALVVGVVLSYLVSPQGNPILLTVGVLLVMVAIAIDAMAYHRRELVRQHASARGIKISIASGILMGLFYPFVSRAGQGSSGLGPYAVAFVFSLGVAVCAVPINLWLMRRPLTGGESVPMSGYFAAHASWHLWAILGGAIWATGAVFNFVASHAGLVGPAVSYAIGQGATMISAIWGVLIWKEFATAPKDSRKLIPYMFLFFMAGLTVLSITPLFK